MSSPSPKNRNRRTVIWLSATAIGMVGLSFASVPLYTMFCQVTGYYGTTQRAEALPGKVSDKIVTVRFDSQTAPDLGWEFRPLQRAVQIRPGEEKTITYRAINRTNKPITGTATYNVTPLKVGVYFDKLECFCFTEQYLAPGQSADLTVSFFVDPDIVTDPNTKEVDTITLSYTMFRKAGAEQVRSSALAAPTPPLN